MDEEEWDSSRMPFVTHMIAGSFGGLAEHVTVFPMDTLKTNMQCEVCGATAKEELWACASKIVRNEGFFRLWRGVSAMFVACVPAHAAYFSVYEGMKKYLITNNGLDTEHQPVRAAFCGAMASVSHDMFMTPFDVVKQRMQLGYYASLGHCVKSIVRSEGVIALYRSLPLTVLMNIPYACFMVSINESMRKILKPFEPTDDSRRSNQIHLLTALFSGAVGGGCAAALTTPLDVVKTRLQTQSLQPCPIKAKKTVGNVVKGVDMSSLHVRKYRSAIQTVTTVVREEGVRGLLRGWLPRVLTNAPAAGISWAVYEGVKNILLQQQS